MDSGLAETSSLFRRGSSVRSSLFELRIVVPTDGRLLADPGFDAGAPGFGVVERRQGGEFFRKGVAQSAMDHGPIANWQRTFGLTIDDRKIDDRNIRVSSFCPEFCRHRFENQWNLVSPKQSSSFPIRDGFWAGGMPTNVSNSIPPFLAPSPWHS